MQDVRNPFINRLLGLYGFRKDLFTSLMMEVPLLMSSGREIPGFIYDPQTNRYYRQRPTHQTTQAHAQLTQRHQRDNFQKEFKSFYDTVSRWLEWDHETLSFQQTLTASQKRPESYEAGSFGSITRPCHNPVVVQNPFTGMSGRKIIPVTSTRGFLAMQRDSSWISWEDGQVKQLSSPLVSLNLISPEYEEYEEVAQLVCRDDRLILGESSRSSNLVHSVVICKVTGNILMGDHIHLDFPPRLMELSNDGLSVALSDGQDLCLWQVSQEGKRQLWSQPVFKVDQNSIKSMAFSPELPESKVLCSIPGRIYQIDGQRRELKFTLPSNRSASQIFTNRYHPQTVYSETFHGELILFDWRFKQGSIALQPPKLGVDDGHNYIVNFDRQIIWRHFGQLGYVAEWDLRRLNAPTTIWSMNRPINQIFMDPESFQLHTVI